MFFCGTKAIARRVTQPHDTYYGDEALVLDWIFYHDAVYKFSIRHWMNKNDDQIQLAGQQKVISKAVFAPERQIVSSWSPSSVPRPHGIHHENNDDTDIRIQIAPTLGCSLELLDLVCQIVDAVLDRDDPLYLSPFHLKTMQSLEFRIRNLEQRKSGIAGLDPHNTTVAELYRLAALIYLSRIARGESRDSANVQELLTQAFDLLGTLDFCLRPWPLFIIALEADTEDLRKTIMKVLDESLKRRPLGSMSILSRMIREAWVQQDLQSEEVDPLLLYNLTVSHNRVPPCFA